MAASVSDLRRWFDQGKTDGKDFMIVVCDTFDHEDYPVYAKGVEEFDEKYRGHDGVNMQRIMEVYNLSLDRDDQLKPGSRVFNTPAGWEKPTQ